MTITIADIIGEATIDVPTTAKLLGVSRDAGYAAAAAGQIPTLRLGRSLRVPVPALLRLLGVDSSERAGSGGSEDGAERADPTNSEAGAVALPGSRHDIIRHQADRHGHDDPPAA